MKSLLLVFAALRFLAELASADRGGTRLAQNDLGECSLICSWNEWLTLLYDRASASVSPPRANPKVHVDWQKCTEGRTSMRQVLLNTSWAAMEDLHHCLTAEARRLPLTFLLFPQVPFQPRPFGSRSCQAGSLVTLLFYPACQRPPLPPVPSFL
ncbi:uncharacterized protein LOC101718966 [Heterocephalus glaber]|uniref:Uncharacterized protein LOC101718966 n=1 Tax=Heterocephalus glaber TaxID=10181 RepID=A0AAX6NZQ4_HETGA|nr:uncharacterized protein LOC101718966 [Heterocephalus glaber]